MRYLIVVALLLVSFACNHGHPDPIDTRYLVIDMGGYGGVMDVDSLDMIWEGVAICYGVDPSYHKALVHIVKPTGIRDGIQTITDPYGKEVYGYAYWERHELFIPPDLSAARHEFAEVISLWAGASRVHGSGCGM